MHTPYFLNFFSTLNYFLQKQSRGNHSPASSFSFAIFSRSSHFEIDYYRKVHGRGITLLGAHTIARPAVESSPGLWTDKDDMTAILNLIKGKRLNFKDMIFEIHSPAEANTVYNRLANEKNFPIGVLFDWRTL